MGWVGFVEVSTEVGRSEENYKDYHASTLFPGEIQNLGEVSPYFGKI